MLGPHCAFRLYAEGTDRDLTSGPDGDRQRQEVRWTGAPMA